VSRVLSLLLLVVLTVTALLAAAPTEEPVIESVAARVGKKRGSFSDRPRFRGPRGRRVTDDSAAIQELIDAKTGSIRFPAGSYRVTRPLVVDLTRSASRH